MSPEQTQCSAVKDVVPLCFTPNGLIGLLLEPIFLPENQRSSSFHSNTKIFILYFSVT